MIKTKPFVLNQSDYLKIVFFHQTAKLNSSTAAVLTGWLVIGVALLFTNPLTSTLLFFGIGLIVYALFYFLPAWLKLSQASPIMQQSYQLSPTHLSVSYQNGRVEQIELRNVQKVYKRFGYYFLYAQNPELLLPIPLDSFNSELDAERFKNIFVAKKLMK